MADSENYVKRSWSGLDNWKCTVGECIFDAFSEEEAQQHYNEVHGPNASVVLQTE
jgi:hypothetical protein